MAKPRNSILLKVFVIFLCAGLAGLIFSQRFFTSFFTEDRLEIIAERYNRELYHINFILDDYIHQLSYDLSNILNQDEIIPPGGDVEYSLYLEGSRGITHKPGNEERKITELLKNYQSTHPQVEFVYIGFTDG